MQTFNNKSLKQYHHEIGMVMKMISDRNAKRRIDKQDYEDANYLSNFKNLSELSLLYGAQDIIKQVPAIKINHEERMLEKASQIPVLYREIGQQTGGV